MTADNIPKQLSRNLDESLMRDLVVCGTVVEILQQHQEKTLRGSKCSSG